MKTLSRITALLVGLMAGAVHAAGETAAPSSGGVGTTIVGEQESAVGLYLMPWQEETPDDSDRPPSLVDAPLTAVDNAGFDATVKTQETIAAFRRSGLPRN